MVAVELIAIVFGVCACVLTYKALCTVEACSKTSFKADAAERRDFFHTLEKLVEKLCTTDMPTTLANHALERSQRVTTDAKVEQAQIFASVPEMPIEDEGPNL